MATSELVSSLRKAGSKLIKKLDEKGLKVGTAFWNYDEEADEWRLVLSMPMVDEAGPAAAQNRIAEALKAAGIKHIYLRQIRPASPRDRLVSSISRLVHTEERAIVNVPLNRTATGGEWIEKAYIYRST